MTEKKEVMVGIGDSIVLHNPAVLMALGLGSCVAVTLFDRDAHVGGLAHVMLPDSSEYAGREENKDTERLMKYADIAIPKMIEKMTSLGANKEHIHAKIVGGSKMFPALNISEDIGQRNIESVKKTLHEQKIPIDCEVVGGSVGRSIRFDIETMKMTVKTVEGEKEF